MKDRLLSGAAWIMLATIATKIVTMVSHLALGYFIAVEDFGVYATAIGMTTVFSWMMNGSIAQLMIRESIAGGNVLIYCRYAAIFNWVSSIGMLLLASALWTNDNHIGLLLLAFAVSQALSLPQLKVRSHFSSLGQFRQLALFDLGLGLLRNVSTIIFAIWWQDERCFAAAIILVRAYELLVSRLIRGQPDTSSAGEFTRDNYKQVWLSARWLLLGALGSAITMQGAFLVLGYWESEATLGYYYFAFQLVTVFSVVVGESIRKVLMPGLSALKSDAERHNIFHRVLTHCAIFVVPISFGAATAVGPVMELLWGEKWLEAVIVAQLMTLTLFVPILVLVCYAYLESLGRWRTRSILQLVDGMLLLIAAGVGAVIGGLGWIVALVSIRRILIGVYQIHLTYRIAEKSSRPALVFVTQSVAVSAASAAIALKLTDWMSAGLWLQIAIALASITLSVAVLSFLLLPKTGAPNRPWFGDQ